jgi:hypothetical protein
MMTVRQPGGDTQQSVAPNVVRLMPIRTLTIARDLAFRQRAMTVLAELGPTAFAVISLDDPAEVVALIKQQRADVVVLDVTFSATELANVVTALSTAAANVGVVAVSDRAGPTGHSLPLVPKWGWASDLAHAAQDAYRRGNPLNEDLPHAGHHQP